MEEQNDQPKEYFSSSFKKPKNPKTTNAVSFHLLLEHTQQDDQFYFRRRGVIIFSKRGHWKVDLGRA
jgi:hypothetical protein